MADEILLRGVRRFWAVATVTAAYEAILAAYQQRLDDVTVMTGKSTEGENATAQVVIGRGDYKEWMDTLESYLAEKEAEAAGTTGPPEGSTTLTYRNRFIEP